MSRTIAIVGAGPGVGLAVAERFGREGFEVALIARDTKKLDDLVSRLKTTGKPHRAAAGRSPGRRRHPLAAL
jgi:short-subunit dehydrogenase